MYKLKKTQRMVGIGIFTALAGISLTAIAGGFQLHEENVTNLGNAYAGTGAQADDASTEFFNPAGMTRIKHPQIVVSGTYIDLDANVNMRTATSSVSGLPLILGVIDPNSIVAVSGSNNHDIGKPAVVPSFHIVAPYTDRWSFGFGVNAPFGLQTEYSNDSIARYLATDSKITVIDFSPSVAYQVTQGLSLGFGVDAQYMDATFDQIVPGIRTPEIPFIAPAQVAPDGVFNNEAHDVGWGWHGGLLYQFNCATRVGLSYHSRVRHDINGDAFLNVNVPPIPVILPVGAITQQNGSISAAATLPDYADLDFYHDFNDQWAMLASVEYTHWSVIDTINANYGGQIATNTVIALRQAGLPFNFRDTWRVAGGLNYKPTEKWTLKTGIAYDESPVANDETRTFRLPDSNRFWVGLGGQYIINPSFTVDFGYTHLFVKDSHINNTQQFFPVTFLGPAVLAQTGIADVSSSVNEVGLQLTWNLRNI